MNNTYTVGESTNQITLSIKVGTVGVAYTSVYFEGKPKIAESNTASGGSVATVIENANKLKNEWLSIHTAIDLTLIEATVRTNAINNIKITYRMEGGQSGRQDFTFSPTDIIKRLNGKNVLIVKSIQLI